MLTSLKIKFILLKIYHPLKKRDCQSFYLSATAVKIPERRNQTNAATEVDVGVQGLEQSGTGIYRGLYLVAGVNKKHEKFIFEYRVFSQKLYLNMWCFEKVHICIPNMR